MKKRILFLFTVFTLVIALVGCTPGMEALNKKTQEVEAWKGSEISGKFEYKIKMEAPEPIEEGSEKEPETKTVEINLPFEISGVAEGQDKAKVKVIVDMKELKKELARQGETEDLKEVPDKMEMDMYASEEDVYINTEYFKNLGLLKDVKEKYIKLSNSYATELTLGTEYTAVKNAELVKYLQSPDFVKELEDLAKVAFKGYDVKEFVKADGNKFEIKFTSDELLDETVKLSDAVKTNWTEVVPKLDALLKKFGAPEEVTKELKDAFKDYDKEELTNSIKMLKAMLNGSSYEEEIEFKNDEYITDMEMKLNISGLMDLELEGEVSTKKNESVNVEFPKDVKSLTFDEFFELLNPNYKLQKELTEMGIEKSVIVRLNGEEMMFDGIQAFIYNDRTYVPVRGLFEKLGAEVNWDDATRTVTIKNKDSEIKLTVDSDKAFVNGKEVKLDAPMINVADRTVAPLRFVSENISYKVKYVPFSDYLAFIDVYNISDEELARKIDELNGYMEEIPQENPVESVEQK